MKIGKNKIIGGILVLVVFVGAYLIFKNKQENSNEQMAKFMAARNKEIQSLPVAQQAENSGTDNLHFVSDLGFSFDYPKDMFVMVDPDTGSRIFVIPNSYKTNEGEELTAVVISAALNEPPMTPLEWLNGPNSGTNMSKGYLELDIDGQKAIAMNGSAWITVNTPDNKRQLSIATLPSTNPNQMLLTGIETIATSFVFSR